MPPRKSCSVWCASLPTKVSKVMIWLREEWITSWRWRILDLWSHLPLRPKPYFLQLKGVKFRASNCNSKYYKNSRKLIMKKPWNYGRGRSTLEIKSISLAARRQLRNKIRRTTYQFKHQLRIPLKLHLLANKNPKTTLQVKSPIFFRIRKRLLVLK